MEPSFLPPSAPTPVHVPAPISQHMFVSEVSQNIHHQVNAGPQTRTTRRESPTSFSKTDPVISKPMVSALSTILKTSKPIKMNHSHRRMHHDPTRLIDCSESLRQGLLLDRQQLFPGDPHYNVVELESLISTPNISGW